MKYLISIMALLLIFGFTNFLQARATDIVCPSGDKFVCFREVTQNPNGTTTEHLVYRGDGVIIQQ